MTVKPAVRSEPSSRTQVGYLLAAAIVGVVTAFSATVVVRHERQPVYDMPSVAVVVAVAATALALVGAGGMLAVRRHDVALLSGVIALMIVFGVLALFTVGLLFLVAGAALAVGLARRASGAGAWAVASGIAMAGDSTGTFTRGSKTYTFTCRDGHLAEFGSVANS